MTTGQEPAFPTHGGGSETDDPRNHTLGGGITVRDLFALGALVGYLSKFAIINATDDEANQDAQVALKHADAMIKERGR